MGIISAFVILAIDVLLWLLPVQGAVESFRTDEITNTFTVAASVSGNATATLSTDLFDANTSLVSVSSNDTSEDPTVAGYDDTTRLLTVADLTPSSNRILTVNYFIDAFPNQTVWSSVLNLAPYFYILVLVVLPVLSIVLFVQGIRHRH